MRHEGRGLVKGSAEPLQGNHPPLGASSKFERQPPTCDVGDVDIIRGSGIARMRAGMLELPLAVAMQAFNRAGEGGAVLVPGFPPWAPRQPA